MCIYMYMYMYTHTYTKYAKYTYVLSRLVSRRAKVVRSQHFMISEVSGNVYWENKCF